MEQKVKKELEWVAATLKDVEKMAAGLARYEEACSGFRPPGKKDNRCGRAALAAGFAADYFNKASGSGAVPGPELEEMLEALMERLRRAAAKDSVLAGQLEKMKAPPELKEWDKEALALELRGYLIDNRLWQDVDIYVNGHCYSTHDKASGKFYYNEALPVIVNEDEDPREYFKYVSGDGILSMSFEGPLYRMLNCGPDPRLKGFNEIFEKYGVAYELGDAWNLTCFYSD